MKRFLSRFLLCVLLPIGGTATVVAACQSMPSTQPIVNTLPPLGICIAQAAIGDIVDAINDPLTLVTAIITACAPYGKATVEQVIAFIESALNAQPVFDAGPEAGTTIALHRTRLNKVHAAALTQVHIVVTVAPPTSTP